MKPIWIKIINTFNYSVHKLPLFYANKMQYKKYNTIFTYSLTELDYKSKWWDVLFKWNKRSCITWLAQRLPPKQNTHVAVLFVHVIIGKITYDVLHKRSCKRGTLGFVRFKPSQCVPLSIWRLCESERVIINTIVSEISVPKFLQLID